MTRARDAIQTVLAHDGGVVLASEHPTLRRTLQRMATEGDLVAVLPGTFCAAGDDRFRTRALAATRHYAGSVVCGTAAARLSFWPELDDERIELAHPHRTHATQHFSTRLTLVRRAIPPTLVRDLDGIRCTTPALTAVDLLPSHGGKPIHRALRSRTVTAAELHAAFGATAHRRGNVERMRVLLANHTAPWSEAEAVAHRRLLAAGITGWTANLKVGVRRGLFVQTYFLDIAFPHIRLALEIEGHGVHGSRLAQHQDRYRQNDLTVGGGWRMLRVDWPMIEGDDTYLEELTRDAIAAFTPRSGPDTPHGRR